MWNRFANYAVVLLISLGLAACASGPPAGPGENTAAVKVDPEVQSQYNQALQAMKSGRDDDALRMLTGLTRKYRGLAGPFINLGLLYIKHDDYKKASQALLQATTIRPDDAIAFNHLGVAYRHLGKFKQAQEAYEQALQLKPDYADAHLNLGILLDVYFNNLPQALEHYERYQALNGNPDNKVAKWIVDLKRRVGNNQKKATS